MKIKLALLVVGFVFLALGIIGKPSNLDERPNTATILFLYGYTYVMIAFLT